MVSDVLFLAGSARKQSFNKALARVAHSIALQKGAKATLIDLKDFPLPIYDGDLEAEIGLPENALALKNLFLEHRALFIASPEYNSSISPLLKNTLDWVSRPHRDKEPALSAYVGKVATLVATSPGQLGGLRGLVAVRMMLGNCKVTVLPEQLAIPHCRQAFDSQGRLQDRVSYQQLEQVVDALLRNVAV